MTLINEKRRQKIDLIRCFTDKTLKMLFQNANTKPANNNNENESIPMDQSTTKRQQFGDIISLMGNGQINYIDPNSKLGSENLSRRCKYCAKPSSIQATDCVNCNLEVCEFCGISCIQCNAPLCMSCVQLL